MNPVDIVSFLDQYDDYDIRVSHNARYVDQKCTPDIVCFIADCIVSTNCANTTFSCNDLWEEQYFIKNCSIIFHKPSPTNPSAKNEYNKVLCQPLKLLAYAHVLNFEVIKKTLFFSVNNYALLDYIATKERNAFRFLYIFFNKVIKDSNLLRFFDEYEESVRRAAGNKSLIKSAKATIYNKYHKFISGNTPSQSKTDVDRIFHKVFNVICYEKMLPGSTCKINGWHDIMYNRPNWRDVGNKKDKDKTRLEAAEEVEDLYNANIYFQYQISKACRLVRKMQGSKSEVFDDLNKGLATEAHHIFPKSAFPSIACYFENLILLTSSQHRTKAHPNSDFSLIDPDYQLLCLLSKANTIENYLIRKDEGFYSKDNFIKVINTGLPEDQIEYDLSFDEIRKYLVSYYNSH